MSGIAFMGFLFFSFGVAIYGIYEILQKRNSLSIMRCITLLVLPIGATTIFCGFPLSIPVFFNNYQLDRFSANLYNYSLPPDTEILTQDKKVSLMGNSNHCDFYVEQTMKTRLSREEIETYYADVVFPPVRDGQQGLDDFWTTGIHTPVSPNLEFQGINGTGQLEFKLFLLDYGYPPGLDFRCH